VQIQVPLVAEHLVIREWNETDAEAYFALRQDPGIVRFVGSSPAFIDQALAWLKTDIQRTRSGTSLRLAIEIGEGSIVGLISLERVNKAEAPGWELVLGIAESHRRGHVAENAARVLISAVLSADSSIAAIYGRREWGNAPSRALVRCLGMRSAGLAAASRSGAICPDRLYVLHRSSWSDA
jgi:RimJ/RimL family protein N-acetyltransferase